MSATCRASKPARILRSTRAVEVFAQSHTGQKRALITGGNTGLGLETAKVLVTKGFEVDVACRDVAKGAAARQELMSLVPGCQVGVIKLELSDLASIRDASKSILDKSLLYDVLINNAGVMATPQMVTKDGFEYQLGVNHLGHFALTNLLLPMLKQNPRPVRILNVSSSAHLIGKIRLDDLMFTQGYQAWPAYAQSKLANIMFTYELARRLPAGSTITANALHPGAVATDLTNSTEGWYAPLIKAMIKPFMKTPAQGAETSIYLAASPEADGVTSKYFVDCKPTASSGASYDVEVARKLWDASAELTKM